MAIPKDKFNKRKKRVRTTLRKRAYGKLRLSVFRSDCHIYAQLIDDSIGKTLTSASTLDKDISNTLKSTSNVEAAAKVGSVIAQRATKLINGKQLEIIFDRGGYIYHGRIKALADAARENGLKF